MIHLFVGAYDGEGSGGIYPLSYHPGQDRWILGKPDDRFRNVSYAKRDPRHDTYIFVHESERGQVGSYRWTDDSWEQLQMMDSKGAAPCFVAMDPAGSLAAITNYASGEVVVFPIDADGRLGETPVIHRNEGSGRDPERQSGPHPHCVQFAYGRIYSADLGTDEILVHAQHEAGGSYTALNLPAGQGPRHLVFHPAKPIAFLLSEMGSTLYTLSVGNDGDLNIVHETSTLPAGYKEESLGGHIELNIAGDRLYVTNRGHESIAVFDVSKDEARMLRLTPTGGKSPRHFQLLEDLRQVVVAHEKEGGVSILQLGDDGSVGAIAHQFHVPKACYVGRLEA